MKKLLPTSLLLIIINNLSIFAEETQLTYAIYRSKNEIPAAKQYTIKINQNEPILQQDGSIFLGYFKAKLNDLNIKITKNNDSNQNNPSGLRTEYLALKTEYLEIKDGVQHIALKIVDIKNLGNNNVEQPVSPPTPQKTPEELRQEAIKKYIKKNIF